MTDHMETEVKFALRDPHRIREALIDLGAEPQGRVYEINIRLDDDLGSIEGTHKALRIRTTQGDGITHHLLTVKMPEEDAGILKSRREIELGIEDAEAMLAVLDVLGYTPFFRYEKYRETFKWRGIEAVIDELPYGWFMEIEGTPDEIHELAAALHLDMADRIGCSYTSMFGNVVRSLGLHVADLTFDAFRGISVSRSDYGC